MKQISLGIVLSVIAVFVVAIILTVNTRTSREDELKASVDAALSSTLDRASLDAVSGEYSDEGMAGLAKEAIRKNITVPKNDKNFALDINIIKADAKNGLISAKVKETYTNPNGRPITIETTRTAAVESEYAKKPMMVSFRYTEEDAKEFSVPDLLAEYTVAEGDKIPVPKTCRFSGFTFKGFYDKDSDVQYSVEDLKKKQMDNSLNGKTFYLAYQSDGVTENAGKLITVRMKPAFSNTSSTNINTGGKDGGTNSGGNSHYYFGYHYCKEHKAIELEVDVTNSVGKTTRHHRFHSANDDFALTTNYPSLQGDHSLDAAISAMISALNIKDYDVAGVKRRITEKDKYTEDVRHVWAYPLPNNKRRYLVFVTAESLQIVNKKVKLTVNAGTGIASTYGGGSYDKGTTVSYGGNAKYGYNANPAKKIVLNSDTTVKVDAVPWKHTLHFDSNGGSTPPPDVTKTYGSVAKIPESVPKREGFNFQGWRSPDGKMYQPNDRYCDDQNGGIVTFKAEWKSGISYDTKTGLDGLLDNISVNDFENDFFINAKSISITKKPSVKYQGVDVSRSVIFIGWNTDPYGKGSWYAHDVNGSTGKFSYNGGDITLYAQYRLKYNLFYDGNEQTEGDNFFATLDDSEISSVSGTKFSFSENPFSKYEDRDCFDKNLEENITVRDKYSFQGWSLNKNAYFNDERVYFCANENRDDGNISDAGIRDFLSECMNTNPCDNIKIDDSYITITTYAVWDKYPNISGYDIGLIKEKIVDLSDSELRDLIIRQSASETDDIEDKVRPVGNPKVTFLNFGKEEIVPQGDYGTSICTLMAKDSAGNISFYQIKIIVTTENFESSRDDGSKNSVIYKRFIDEENFSKSFSSYDTNNESVLGVTDRKKAHADGGMEVYSKWLLSDELKEEMKKAFA